jgi:hypothetical protein
LSLAMMSGSQTNRKKPNYLSFAYNPIVAA